MQRKKQANIPFFEKIACFFVTVQMFPLISNGQSFKHFQSRKTSNKSFKLVVSTKTSCC